MIMETTGITKEQYLDCQCIPVGHTLGQTIMGFFIDTVGLKLSFAICAAIWGSRQWGMPNRNMVRSAFMRALMGFSEASAIPAGCKTASTWFPAKERGVATGVFNMAPHRRDACSTVDCSGALCFIAGNLRLLFQVALLLLRLYFGSLL